MESSRFAAVGLLRERLLACGVSIYREEGTPCGVSSLGGEGRALFSILGGGSSPRWEPLRQDRDIALHLPRVFSSSSGDGAAPALSATNGAGNQSERVDEDKER